MEKIILSAIMTGENQCAVALHPESRHPFIIHHLAKSGFKTPIKGEQGFLTSEGRFVDRLEALHIAKSAGQIDEADLIFFIVRMCSEMERIQPFFRLNKKKKYLEVARGFSSRQYELNDEEISIVQKLIERDFMTAILYRRHSNEAISIMANNIIEQKG